MVWRTNPEGVAGLHASLPENRVSQNPSDEQPYRSPTSLPIPSKSCRDPNIDNKPVGDIPLLTC
jgi:hypothetical protein